MLLDYCAVNYMFYLTKNNDKQITNLRYKVVKIFCPKLNALLFREAIKCSWMVSGYFSDLPHPSLQALGDATSSIEIKIYIKISLNTFPYLTIPPISEFISKINVDVFLVRSAL